MPTSTSFTELYTEVQQFYARQMRQLDERKLEAYAETFTEDAEFGHTPGREPARTRAGIAADLHEFHKRFENDPVQRRHWFNMIDLEPQDDGSIRSTCYALVITTRPGGKPDIAPSCVVRDVIVRGEDGGLLLRSRKVEHDQLF
ncbi:nuclear transport factor 2 family protein [Micromonospora purpureochromogenes]|uniref:nuclear transport factor 2 family protein n=1 Tax=Micromonospora TaxID=1873 RepID=UPI001A61C416|nr:MULTISPECIES: nuclear transport factor 2 family protein [unclassified Micromonospora]MBM0256435.1 nuclear transport factor 2 family protein [Micromonospora sp. 4G55]MBQ0895936.1 nuclear transport factor 2 family protein [Micromonospora sp. U56]MDH6460757.1 actinorhodin biosynthesis protein ActVIA [Micromonospora sp. A200]